MNPRPPPDPRKDRGLKRGDATGLGEAGSPGRRTKRNRNYPGAEFQGQSNARNAKQRPPSWGRPKQAAALDDLNRAFGGAVAGKRFVVQITKSSGRRVEYSRYATEAEAREAAKLLAWAGCPSRVVEAAS